MGRVKMTVKVRGLTELERKLTALPRELNEALKRAIQDETEDIAEDLRQGAPVDEGVLRDSIQVELAEDGLSGDAVITAPHAGFVIRGTDDTRANDFTAPVIAAAERRFADRVRDEVAEALERRL